MRNQKGQVLPLMAFILIAICVLVGVFIDASIFYLRTMDANNNAAIACQAAAAGGGYSAFSEVMMAHGYPESYFSPNEGTGKGLVKGYEYQSDTSFRVAIQWDEPTYFLSLVGIDSMGILGRARCIERRGGLAPIAVWDEWFWDSVYNGTEYPILGLGTECESQPGHDFAGAIYDLVTCYDGIPCAQRIYYPPIPEDYGSMSCQPLKDFPQAEFKGEINPVFKPIGTWIPHVSGVSDKMLVKAMIEGGWEVGDKVYVIVFDGWIYKADYADCDNLQVVHYAEATITEIGTNYINATFYDTEPIFEIGDIQSEIYAREISWEFDGVLP